MSRFEKRFLLGLGLLVLALSILEANAPEPVDWAPSYSRYHRTPYGGQLVFERLTDLFPEVRTTHEPVYVNASARLRDEDIGGAPVNHLFVNTRFGPDELATRHLLELARHGDHLFLAAEEFHGPLADTLHLAMERRSWAAEDTSEIRFSGRKRIAEGVFRYARGFPGACFTRYDSSRTRVLAVDGASNPVLLEMAWGAGRIVLCSAPLAFTNHNLLKDDNARFMAGALSALPPVPVVWDEFHKVGRMESPSIVRFLLKEPALRWAWTTAQVLVLLFMLVHVRRQQRPIPVITPPRNASRDLAHTIGRLYWHKGDHTGLAHRMIAHFKEDVRARAHLRTFAYDAATIAHLAAKTGLSEEETARRLGAVQQREEARRLTEQDLLGLSTELHDFRQLIR